MEISKPKVAFGIPLRAKEFSNNWDLVCKNLERTLSSLSRQNDLDFKVYIASHDYPPINFYNLNVRILLAPFPPPKNNDEIGRDKGRKKRMIGTALREEGYESLYFMHLDADDLVDPTLVEFVRKDNNNRGYLMSKGYMCDIANKSIAICNENNSPFYKHCGSCAIVYFKNDELPMNYQDNNCYFSKLKNHTKYKEVAKNYGRPLKLLKNYMVVYLVNHGENNRIYKGKGATKERFVERNRITSKKKIHSIRTRFPELESF